MKYLLVVTLTFYFLTFWALANSNRPSQDDFGGVFLELFCGVTSAVLTLTYIALVFWNHRFL